MHAKGTSRQSLFVIYPTRYVGREIYVQRNKDIDRISVVIK
jgi:hypothetical protein